MELVFRLIVEIQIAFGTYSAVTFNEEIKRKNPKKLKVCLLKLPIYCLRRASAHLRIGTESVGSACPKEGESDG